MFDKNEDVTQTTRRAPTFNGGSMYRNIMVPVDGSPFAREAVLHGLRIASQTGATLRLVRVGSAPILHSGPEGFSLENEKLRELHTAELADLYSIAAECRAHSTVNVTASVQHGPVVDTLIGYARRQRVDLIVMRSHARKGLARVWFGSVADALIRDSGIPVLVVRPPSVATGLDSGFSYRRILVPLDGSLLAEQSLRPAMALARIDQACVTLLMVITPPQANRDGELQSAIGPASAREVAAAQRYLDWLVSSHPDRSTSVIRRVVISDDVPGSILSAAEGMEADLIAIATRGRGAIARATSGSVADRVVRESPVSTMVIHPMSREMESPVFSPEAALAQA
jgi:nucleotide-binding universal stress UspA family protein